MLLTWGGRLLLTNGMLTLGPAADECCCVGGEPCCPDEPETSLLLTFTSECADVDGHTVTVKRILGAWQYSHVDDGNDAVFQDLHIDIICDATTDRPGGAAYKITLSTGCLATVVTDLYAGLDSTCDPFVLNWDGVSSGVVTSECFECVGFGESFTYSIQATVAP